MICSHCNKDIDGRIHIVDRKNYHWLCKTKIEAQKAEQEVKVPPPFKVGDAVKWCTSTGRGGRPIEAIVVELVGKSAIIKLRDKGTRCLVTKRVLLDNLVHMKENTSPGFIGSTMGHLWGN